MNTAWREHMLRRLRTMEALLPQAEAELKRFPNVEFVSVGAKFRQQRVTPELAFQVFVRAKVDPVELSPQDQIPAQFLDYPTDVVLAEREQEIQAPEADKDQNEYRPLSGGTAMEQGPGTLGMIALAAAGGTAPAGDPVILTNNHNVPEVGKLVGQPHAPCDCYCCKCYDVGICVESLNTRTVDAAIAMLNPGMRYAHEIVEIGAVRGHRTAASLIPGTDRVVKRGRTTGLTTGIVANVSVQSPSGAHDQQIRIVAPSVFAKGGDSGSVVLDTENRVVGLLWASTKPHWMIAYANQIEEVMAAMHITIPMMGTAGAIPLTAGGMSSGSADRRAAFAVLDRRLRTTPAGRGWLRLVDRHRDEVLELVRKDRRTGAAWQRYQGPSFVAHYLKTVVEPEYTVPPSIGGMSMENLLLGMAALLQQHGSPELAADVRTYYLDIIRAARGCRRAADFLNRLSGQGVLAPVS